MKTFISLFFLFMAIACVACSDNSATPAPPPEPEVKPGEIALVWGTIPAEVQTGKEVEFTLKASAKDHPEAFTFAVDTTFPASCPVTVNNIDLKGVTTVTPDRENTVKFTPVKEGNYKLNFTITDKNNKKATKEVTIKALSPIVTVTVNNLPDSVAVETAAEFSFKVEGAAGTDYTFSVDTVIPVFNRVVINNGGFTLPGGPRKGVDLAVNGKALTEVVSVTAGTDYTFKFANPQVVGDYRITLNLTSKAGVKTVKEVVVKAYSPNPVIMKFYETDPWIELDISDRKQFYKVLNERYTYKPLSSVFVGKRVDTIYTKESIAPGIVPEEWTFPGRGTTCYLAQEGGKDFFMPWIDFDAKAYTLTPNWDGGDVNKIQKQGFHGLLFLTNPATERAGEATYTFYVYDHWGKLHTEKITVVALDRNQVKPATGHRIPD